MSIDDVRARIDREREHWDSITTDDIYDGWVEKPYDEWREGPSLRRATDYLGPLKGKRILVCSEGKEVVPFAREGAEVWCFDLSEARLKVLQRFVDAHGLTDRVHLAAMPFEEMTYEDDFFDLAFGWAVVHHVDLTLAGNELARVLKPGARASFIEPLGVNPILQFARKKLPYRHKGRTEDEAPFTYTEIKDFGKAFKKVQYREFALLSMLHWRIIESDRVGRWLVKGDNLLLRLPFMRPLCAVVWIGIEN